MRLVESIDEIHANMDTLDSYLSDESNPEYSYAVNLIKKGICFLADKKSGHYRFYPSRFIGYKENTMNRHESNQERDGRVTNVALSKIIGSQYAPDDDMDREYRAYCVSLGFKPSEKGAFGVARKYWRLQ